MDRDTIQRHGRTGVSLTFDAPGRLLIVMTRDPGDAVVDATLGEQLRLLNVPPSSVTVAAALNRNRLGELVIPSFSTDVHVIEVTNVFLRLFRLWWLLRQLIVEREFDVISVRDDLAAVVLRFCCITTFNSPAIILDRRGDAVAEAALKGTHGWRLKLLSLLSRHSAGYADRVMTVSTRLLNDMRKVIPNIDGVVVPNLAAFVTDIGSATSMDRPLLLFAGGGQAWQHKNYTLRLLSAVQYLSIDVEVISNDICLLNEAIASGLSTSTGDRRYVIERVRTATASIMLREANSVNEVASPVKLGEALSVGTPVIATVSTWERIKELEDDGLAWLVPVDGVDLEGLCRFLEDTWLAGVAARSLRLDLVKNRWTLKEYESKLLYFYFGTVQ